MARSSAFWRIWAVTGTMAERVVHRPNSEEPLRMSDAYRSIDFLIASIADLPEG